MEFTASSALTASIVRPRVSRATEAVHVETREQTRLTQTFSLADSDWGDSQDMMRSSMGLTKHSLERGQKDPTRELGGNAVERMLRSKKER